MNLEIKKISPQETLWIRHKAMWPNKPLAYVQLPYDAIGRHFGLYFEEELIAVISIFCEEKEVQFRKFATLEEYQGKGYGSKLLNFIIELAEQEGYHKIWCNARISKTKFYNKFGLKETDKHFEKGGIAYVVMEKISSQ